MTCTLQAHRENDLLGEEDDGDDDDGEILGYSVVTPHLLEQVVKAARAFVAPSLPPPSPLPSFIPPVICILVECRVL